MLITVWAEGGTIGFSGSKLELKKGSRRREPRIIRFVVSLSLAPADGGGLGPVGPMGVYHSMEDKPIIMRSLLLLFMCYRPIVP